MAKPSVLPRWNTDLSNQTDPSSGQKDSGWTVDQPAVSSYFNWLFYTIYLWLQWIDAGILTAVSMVTSGVVTVGGLLTASAGLALTGALTMTGNLLVTGNGSFSGTLTMIGEEYHPTRTRYLWFGAGAAQSGSWTRSGNSYITGATGAIWEIPLSGLRIGDQLLGAAVQIRYDGGVNTITARLMKNVGGTVTTIDTATSSTPGGAATPAFISLSATDVVQTGEVFWIEIEQGTANSGMRTYSASYSWNRIP